MYRSSAVSFDAAASGSAIANSRDRNLRRGFFMATKNDTGCKVGAGMPASRLSSRLVFAFDLPPPGSHTPPYVHIVDKNHEERENGVKQVCPQGTRQLDVRRNHLTFAI